LAPQPDSKLFAKTVILKLFFMNTKKTLEVTNDLLFPSLPYEEWKDTLDTLHLWTQIVGKIKLKQSSFINHWWEVAFHINARGMTTGRIPYKNFAFEITFDFINHTVTIYTSTGKKIILLLRPQTVKSFYSEFMSALESVGILLTISQKPSEIPNAIDFDKDTTHASYDKEWVEKWWQIQLQASFILDTFRSRFRGKSSAVNFFWGSFDLNTTRFSGKLLPDKTDWPKGYAFMRYAENEENFACGFWPGGDKFPDPAFYTYLYPAPPGCETIKTGPSIAYYNKHLSECLLPYEKVRKTKNPEKEILAFFQTTYVEYTKLAGWNSKDFEEKIPKIK
jgi:uncharacterized protein DUF5996